MVGFVLSIWTLVLQVSISFMSTYPTEYNDFVSNLIILPENEYLLFGATDSPSSSGTRIIRTNCFGECILDSLPPCNNITGCLSPDSCITSVFTQMNDFVIQKTTTDGIECWREEYPDYSEFVPRKVINSLYGGYVVISEVPEEESSLLSLLKFDEYGLCEWITLLPSCSPTGVSEDENGSLAVTLLNETGSEIAVFNSSGELQDQFNFPGCVFRDVLFWNNGIAVAAVGDGILFLGLDGSVVWNYNPPQTIEIFNLTRSLDDNIVGTGSTLEGSQRRSLLVKLEKDGSAIWSNAFGFGVSFRSIYVSLDPDGGFCSLGGYQNEGTLNSFFIKTDSLGFITQQGIEPEGGAPDLLGIMRLSNPVSGSSVILHIGKTSEAGIDLSVINLSGRILRNLSIVPDNSTESIIELGSLETGIYFLRAATSERSACMRFTVLKE